MDKKNELLTRKLSELEERANREQILVADGFQTVLSKEDFLSLVDWKEKHYSNRSDYDKQKAAWKKGVIFHESKGRSANTQITVTITNFMWYCLMVQDVTYSKVAAAYLDDVFTKKGELELGGVYLVAVLDEYAEKYAEIFNDKATATKRKISRVREPMNKKGYLDKGKKSSLKQKRVIRKGETNYLQGPDAWRLSKEIDISYAIFGKDLAAKISFRRDDSPALIKQKVELCQQRIVEYTAFLKEKYGLERIFNNYGSTLSERAEHDYQDIIALFMAGATIEEIKRFLEETLALWIEEQNQIRDDLELSERARNGDVEAAQELREREERKLEEALGYLGNVEEVGEPI